MKITIRKIFFFAIVINTLKYRKIYLKVKNKNS